MAIPFHPIANLFPLIEGHDFEVLIDDIRTNGLREPIVLLDGMILDGRNRYRALIGAQLIGEWMKLGDLVSVGVSYRHFNPKTDGDPLAWVLSKNLHRRHLSESQRAMIADALARMPRGRPSEWTLPADDKSSNLSNLSPVKQADAAELLNVSRASVQTAARVREHGAPELVDAVKRGEVTVSAAAEVAKLPVSEQLDVLRGADPRAFARVAKERRAVQQADKRERRDEREAELGARQAALPTKKYGVILEDPEWRFEVWSRESGMDRAADNHYPTSELYAIMARDVASIAADDAAYLLWATVPMLRQALKLMEARGFAYKSHWVWLKDAIGTGYWNRNQHELLLLGTRGDVPAPAMGTQFRSALAHPAGDHSAKPPFAHEIAEAYFPSLAKIELNARARRPGWDAWGFEAPGNVSGGDVSAENGSSPSETPDREAPEESHAKADDEAEAIWEVPPAPTADVESVSRLAAGRTAAGGEAVAGLRASPPPHHSGRSSRVEARDSPSDASGDPAIAVAVIPHDGGNRAYSGPLPASREAARPILEARYATTPAGELADELGVPVPTLRTWAFRLGLTSKDRIRESGKAWAAKLHSPTTTNGAG